MRKVFTLTLAVITILILNSSCRDKEKIDAASSSLSDVLTSDIKEYSVQLSASITKSGNNPIIEHGFAVSKSSDKPEIDDKSIKKGAIDPATPTPITFSGSLSNLEPKTEYFVRAFASSSSGISYSKSTKFTTSDIIQPLVKTDGADNISHNAATLKASITSKGTHPITEYGIVWGTEANPTTALATKTSTKANVSTFPTAFTASAGSLSPNTTYNFRAYVISNGVTSYGENKSFKTADVSLPNLSTGNASSIGINSAKLAGTLNSGGTFAITERGVVWNTSANPTTAHSKASIAGNVTQFPNNYTVDANGLQAKTTYHYRAYVISNGQTYYGENKQFTTAEVANPSITTGGASSIGSNSAVLAGTLNSGGSFAISERGVVWNTTTNPTTANFKASIAGNVTQFPNDFTLEAKNLKPNVAYYYRAYVISNGQTYYGENKQFTTAEQIVQPIIQTDNDEKNGTDFANFFGTIVSKGSHPITEYGFVYATTNNPTVSNTKKVVGTSVNSTPHKYNSQITNLTPGGTYYYRAYAIMNGTVTYGQTKMIKLSFQEPVVKTGTPFNIIGRGVQLSGEVSSQGSFPITEIGIVYGNTATPTTANSKVSKSGSGITYPHSYGFLVQGISTNNGLSARAYVISNGITYYGNSVRF